MNQFVIGASTLLFTFSASLFISLSGCTNTNPCQCPEVETLNFPEIGISTIVDVNEYDTSYCSWEDSSWQDVVAGTISVNGVQFSVSYTLNTEESFTILLETIE